MLKSNEDESSDGEAVIQQENGSLSNVTTASVRVLNAHDDLTSTLKEKEDQWMYQGKVEIEHGKIITSKNRNNTVNTSRER